MTWPFANKSRSRQPAARFEFVPDETMTPHELALILLESGALARFGELPADDVDRTLDKLGDAKRFYQRMVTA